MPIGLGDYVAVHRVEANFMRGFQGQPPQFGICSALQAGEDRSILWADGTYDANLDENVLDRIVAEDPAGVAAALLGAVVELDINPTPALQASGSYDATVAAVYRREQAGDGVFTENLVLCKLLNSEDFIETLASNATAQANR